MEMTGLTFKKHMHKRRVCTLQKIIPLMAAAIVFGVFLSQSLEHLAAPTQQQETKRQLHPDVCGEPARQQMNNSPHPNRPINAPDLMSLSFRMAGSMYDESGSYTTVNATLRTALIHNFSPHSEQRFREMMLDPAMDHKVYANSPTMVWRGNKIQVILRMWLEKEKHKRTAVKVIQPRNDYSDNYLYTQDFDSNFKPLSKGQLLGIATPTQWYIGDGPIEPRLFKFANRTFMTFNTGAVLKDGAGIDSTFVWDIDESRVIIPTISGGAPMMKESKSSGMKRDKHWAAFESDGQLYFTYSLDPLRVLHCELNFSCEFVLFEGPADYVFTQRRDHLRGGTPWMLFEHPYYISLGHGTFFKSPSSKRYYSTHILVMSVHPTYRIVYASAPIQVHPKILDGIPIVRFVYIHDSFLFPVSALLESDDTLTMGAHVNDYSSIVVRIRGIRQLMRDVIATDRSSGQRGPPMGTVHSSTRVLAETQSGYTFYEQSAK